ncbi:MAG: hypothetical protein ACNS60_17920 [Candidatus Cyclobacteriaceae bacterium M2_1C_046]
MKKLMIILLLGISITVYGQKDKIYLKNGSIIRGTIQNYPVQDTISVIIMGRSKLAIPIEAVDEVRFRRRNGEKPKGYKDLIYRTGMATSFKTGFLLGNHSYADPLKAWLTLEVAQEYHYHPLLNGSIGIGVNYYQNYTVFPLYLEYQAVLGKRHKSWFLYGRAGHGFINDRQEETNEMIEQKGGMHLGAGIGIQRRVGDNYLRFKFGYHSQTVTEKTNHDWWWGIREPSPDNYTIKKRHMNRLNVGVEYVLNY